MRNQFGEIINPNADPALAPAHGSVPDNVGDICNVHAWAAACATGHQCVIIKFGETERHLTRDDAERFAAAIYRACSDSCKFSFIEDKQPNDPSSATRLTGR
jgi:hypothetical protein